VRAVVQRVSRASVAVADETVAGEIVGRIDEPGLVVLVGVTDGDTSQRATVLAAKVYHLRILAGERSASDIDAPLLVVSQFTLYADTSKGRRPSWNAAAPAELAEPLLQAVVDALRALGARVATGRFGAAMHLELVNEGPMTLLLEV
jgi:D-aminoacyl-tRNA deacylase